MTLDSLLNRGGECAILDGTYFTRDRRQSIQSRIAEEVTMTAATVFLAITKHGVQGSDAVNTGTLK